MREFNKVSTTLWRSRKFRSLPDDGSRMVYMYLLTCPHGNSAGCFDIHPMYACADLGWKEEVYLKAIDSLCFADLIAYDKAENTVLIVNWQTFNEPTNPKHAIGLLAQLEQASSIEMKTRAFHGFLEVFKAKKFDQDQALRKAIDIFLKAYPKPIATETKTEIETEIETRPDQTKTETRESPRAALRTVAAEGRDGLTPEKKATPPPGGVSSELQRLLESKSRIGAA